MKKQEQSPYRFFEKAPAHFKVRLKVKLPVQTKALKSLSEIELWAKQNLKGRIVFDSDIRYIWFESEEDAILFKLTWA